MNNININFIYCTVTLQECVFNIIFWRKLRSKLESSGLKSGLIQHSFKFKHEKICVSLDKQINSRLNFLVGSGLQTSIATQQSYVDFNERFVIKIQ